MQNVFVTAAYLSLDEGVKYIAVLDNARWCRTPFGADLWPLSPMCARYASHTHTHARLESGEAARVSRTRRSHSRINGALFSLILAFRDSGQSPSDFWQNGIARNGHYLSRYAYVRMRVKGRCELTNTDAAGILCTLALIMPARAVGAKPPYRRVAWSGFNLSRAYYIAFTASIAANSTRRVPSGSNPDRVYVSTFISARARARFLSRSSLALMLS